MLYDILKLELIYNIIIINKLNDISILVKKIKNFTLIFVTF